MEGFFTFGSPMVELGIEGRKTEMLLDTGFNGQIMLPQTIINDLDLEQIGISDYLTASGDGTVARVYKGRLLFFDEERDVSIVSTEADFSLAGMELFQNCKIIIEKNRDIVEVQKSR
ncbi:hypothetical protein CL622_02690 [archaeon]|nr:hypothetical protein [archaeon]